MKFKKVYVVILNYNGWRDTLECLESVLKLDYPNLQIVVVDNDSSDGSVARIEEWAAGVLPAGVANPVLARLSTPAHGQAVPLQLLTPDQLEHASLPQSGLDRIVLVKSDVNGGYAAGNNLGIRLAMQDRDCAYLWLLNNDTVVEPDALAHMVARFEGDPKVGICGSTLLHYHAPSTIQARGGARFNRWTATSKHVGEGDPYPPACAAAPEEALDYVVGASMFVSRRFVEQAGLMYEDYFLYFEEIDWSLRRGGLKLAYEPKSVVYHKEGASTGMNKKAVQYGRGGDFYLHRNRLVFARRNFPLALPVVVLRLAVVFFKSIQAGRWGRAKMFLSQGFWFGTGKI
jgi:GT2 family glycosyltransferase